MGMVLGSGGGVRRIRIVCEEAERVSALLSRALARYLCV
jgi:hypothetical protein